MWVQFRDDRGTDAGLDTRAADEFRAGSGRVRWRMRGQDVAEIPAHDPVAIVDLIVQFLSRGAQVLDLRPVQYRRVPPDE